ncbi:hypothetical protein GE061_009990 [Apolygus lucorum]|uniref:Uncharacterized protein n=1 Tax=Apolygus lucorum TaxID=248454 RepID=A0A6A4JWN8_APOLU|nr:hypothetical protein GE061_009990 [Apolygus lucorum]
MNQEFLRYSAPSSVLTTYERGIFWSFRFPVSRRKMAPTPGTPMSPPQPHMDISKWLNILDLTDYTHVFDTYKGVEDLLEFTEADIKEMGVKNAAHRARIVSSLVALKEKYNKGQRRAEKSTLRHSVAVDPVKLVPENNE